MANLNLTGTVGSSLPLPFGGSVPVNPQQQAAINSGAPSPVSALPSVTPTTTSSINGAGLSTTGTPGVLRYGHPGTMNQTLRQLGANQLYGKSGNPLAHPGRMGYTGVRY